MQKEKMPMGSDPLKEYAKTQAQGVKRVAMLLQRVAERVHRELTDKPQYFETYRGSIEAHKSLYGADPLMPLFLATPVLDNKICSVLRSDVHLPGSTLFKFMYGVRAVLYEDPNKVNCVGCEQLVVRYNREVATEDALDKQRVANGYKVIIRSLQASACDDCYNDAFLGAVDGLNVLQKAVDAVESGDAQGTLTELARVSGDVVGGDDNGAKKRQKMRMDNLIDLAIVPVNPFMARREIPFTYIYNYSYTFDEVIGARIGARQLLDRDSGGDGSDLNLNHTRVLNSALFVKNDGSGKFAKEYTNALMLYRFMLNPLAPALGKLNRIADDDDRKNAKSVFKALLSDNNYMMISGVPLFLKDCIYDRVLQLGRGDNDSKSSQQPQKTPEQKLADASIRFNYVFTRFLAFTTHAFRLVRSELSNEISKYRPPVTNRHRVVSHSITEFGNLRDGIDNNDSSRNYVDSITTESLDGDGNPVQRTNDEDFI